MNNKDRTIFLNNVKFKQNDIDNSFYSAAGKNEHCYSVTLFVMACCEAGIKPTKQTYQSMIKAVNNVSVDLAGFVFDYEKLPAYYYHQLTGKKKKFTVIGWSKNNEHYIGNYDYALFNIKTVNGSGHFLLHEYDPWRGGTQWQSIKSIKYYKVDG